jgi:hypothetical protein
MDPGASFQFGRTSMRRPRAPHLAHTTLPPNHGTGRRMRAGPPEPPAPPPLTEAARKRLEEEQEAGRRALAAHQARGC